MMNFGRTNAAEAISLNVVEVEGLELSRFTPLLQVELGMDD